MFISLVVKINLPYPSHSYLHIFIIHFNNGVKTVNRTSSHLFRPATNPFFPISTVQPGCILPAIVFSPTSMLL